MATASKVGALYALMVFLIGFMLGTVRLLLIVPRLGATAAVWVETPFMLAASWSVCRWCVDRLDVRLAGGSIGAITAHCPSLRSVS